MGRTRRRGRSMTGRPGTPPALSSASSRPGRPDMRNFPNLTVIEHPLIQHKLAVLRDRDTSKKTFRALVDEISMLMGYEVTKDLPLREIEVETPLERTTARMVSGK